MNWYHFLFLFRMISWAGGGSFPERRKGKAQPWQRVPFVCVILKISIFYAYLWQLEGWFLKPVDLVFSSRIVKCRRCRNAQIGAQFDRLILLIRWLEQRKNARYLGNDCMIQRSDSEVNTGFTFIWLECMFLTETTSHFRNVYIIDNYTPSNLMWLTIICDIGL